jgi:hypothetical protein
MNSSIYGVTNHPERQIVHRLLRNAPKKGRAFFTPKRHRFLDFSEIFSY